jgi:adenylate cyclase
MYDVLFIDDEEGVRRSVQRALRRENYSTHVTESGREGIRFLEGNRDRIATVISDYRMPGMDGLTTLSRMAKINPAITRIILTGYATLEAAIEATNQGIDGFLTKPFDNLVLRRNIREIVVRKYLRQFVSEQVYQEIREAPEAIHPRYHRATIVFCDIRGFTRMSHGIAPEKLAAFLNQDYFTPVGEIACRHGGTVDKHLGDGMMLVFGAPAVAEDDALRAVAAAVEIQQAARRINRRLRRHNGLSLQLGIGMATGRVFSGLLGSLQKKEFSSIGMAVNMAARLESLAVPGEILSCHQTVAALETVSLEGRFRYTELPPRKIKGFVEPVAVYRIEGC